MVLRTLAAACLLAATPLSAPGRHSASRPAGAIDGMVTLKLRPPRQLTGRYPGAAPTPHAVQSLPAVAYLKGRIAGAPPVAPARDPVMMQHDTAFVPPALVIPVGTTVSFPNDDPFFHNVFSYSRAKRFDLGRYPKGQAKQVTFNEPGVVKVYCEVHNFMRSIIVVTENPFATVVADDGSFHIEGVPPGTYTLVIWHADLGEVEQSVVVPADGAVHVKAELG